MSRSYLEEYIMSPNKWQGQTARKLSQDEVNSYVEPIHYISHHAVAKPGFDSSHNYKGHCLNDY